MYYCLYFEEFDPNGKTVSSGRVRLTEDRRRGVFLLSSDLQLLTRLAEPFGLLAQHEETRYRLLNELLRPSYIPPHAIVIHRPTMRWITQSQKERRVWRINASLNELKKVYPTLQAYQPHELVTMSPDLDQYAVEANFLEASKDEVGTACFIHPGPKHLIPNHVTYFVISGIADDVVTAASLPSKHTDSLLNAWLMDGMKGLPSDTPRKIIKVLQRLDTPAMFSEHMAIYAADRKCMTRVVNYLKENGLKVSRDAVTAQLDYPIFAGYSGGVE